MMQSSIVRLERPVQTTDAEDKETSAMLEVIRSLTQKSPLLLIDFIGERRRPSKPITRSPLPEAQSPMQHLC